MSALQRMVTVSLMVSSLCTAQTLRVEPDIAIVEAEYRDASENWLRNDPNLERDLFRGQPDEMRRRVRRAAGLRDVVMDKKATYVDLLVKRLQTMRSRLTQPDDGSLPAESLKRDLAAQQAHWLADQERLEALLRDMPEGDEYLLVRRALSDERINLVNLQNNIAMRIRSLDSVGKTQDALQIAGGEGLVQKLDDILKVWDDERASIIRQRAKWAEVYAAMERALDKQAPAGQGHPAPNPSKKKTKESRQNDDASGKPAPARSRQPSLFAGVWVYRSQPGAWTGYGEPESVTLDLRDDGMLLSGTYVARLPGRSETHDVRLALDGPRSNGKTVHLHWKSTTPETEGQLELKLGSDSRMLVSRTASGDGYIPCGMEVLLPRH